MSYPRGHHPNSVANLKPWRHGESGNPHGRTAVGMSYREWLNLLDAGDADGNAKYTDSDLEAMIDDPTQTRAKRAAAADLLDMRRRDYHKAVPLRANPIDRVCDRTEGKPIARVVVQTHKVVDPAQLIGDLRAALADLPPHLLPQVNVAGLLPEPVE